MSLPTTSAQDLEKLYAEHYGWLQSWLHGRLGCRLDAEDLAQDTFIRVSGRADRSETLRQPRHFLLTVAKGLTIDLFRRRTLERQYLEALAAIPKSHWPSEEHRALILETLVELDAMLSGLGSKVREAFLLSQCDGLTYPQIAESLGVSLRTVNNYMAKAMEHCCLYRLEQETL